MMTQMTQQPKVRSQDIKKALSVRHRLDLFLTEVKNGPTMTGLKVIDALAVAKSWSKPCISGYEIKVSRNDFIRDTKWPAYLEMTNRFSFVCPKGLISPDDLPKNVGLIYFNPDKGTLYTKRAPIFRQIDLPENMLYYLLMNRVDSASYPFFNNKAEYFKEYLENKSGNKGLGKAVKTKLTKEVDSLQRKVDRLEKENRMLSKDAEAAREVEVLLNNLGIYVFNSSEIPKHVKGLIRSNLPTSTRNAIKRINEDLSKIVSSMEGQ